MKIEWASHFRSDGSRRKPPPSVMHGWLAKMRGTLLGNEDLRTKGMQEMRAARHYRQYRQSQPKPSKRKSVDRGSSALFGTLNPKPRPPQYRSASSHRVVGRPPPRRSSQHSSAHLNSRRPTASRQSSRPIQSRRPSGR
ncbi:hypothetical protein MVEN_01227600 [Mycena venus]|uniref:Uncharacterized protein n=1 Tax=Mycena venus TaxID=2733690 RepID=A0A8H6Y217_9AGAR|nr:hypothetical protein MVEN_01227600 [Mycena venus]